MIEVPDQSLLPAHLNTRSVIFRAGLELAIMHRPLWALAIMHRPLWALAVLRCRWGFAIPDWLVALVYHLSRPLRPLGTDTGGIVVRVTGTHGGVWTLRRWRLRALNGDGPFIPGVPARAILRQPGRIRPGARPALSELPLAAFEAAMGDLAVTTDRDTWPVPHLFATLPGFTTLPSEIKAAHDVPAPRIWSGRSRVTRGRGPVAQIVAALFRFPPETDDIALQVTMQPEPGGERLERRFGDARFVSHLQSTPCGITERFGPMTFLLDLTVRDNALHYPVKAGRFLGVAIPRPFLPRSVTTERVVDGRFTFDVRLSLPFSLGMVVHYQGWLTRAQQD